MGQTSKQGSTTTAAYTYGNALTRKDGETPLFDGQGSERTVTNTAGAVQGTLTLSAFGQAVASSGSSTSAYQYAATSRYRNDGDAGLALVGCRYYDAQVGAFISRDTYLDQKPYAYCDGDPVNATDPSGHSVHSNNYGAIMGFAGLAIGCLPVVLFAPEVVVGGVVVTGVSEILASTGITGILVSGAASFVGTAVGTDMGEAQDKADEEAAK